MFLVQMGLEPSNLVQDQQCIQGPVVLGDDVRRSAILFTSSLVWVLYQGAHAYSRADGVKNDDGVTDL